MKNLFFPCCIFAIFTVFAAVLSPALAMAAQHRVVAEGTFIMGDNDTRKGAEEKALQDAMKIAVKKAGVFVKAYAEMRNHRLTDSQVQTISAGLIEVNNHSTSFDTDLAGRWICHVIIDSIVDDANINFEALVNEHQRGGSGPAYTTPVSQGGGGYIGGTDWSKARNIVLDCRKFSNYIHENDMVGDYMRAHPETMLNLGWMTAVVRGENGIVAVSPAYYYRKGDDYRNSKNFGDSSPFNIVDDIYNIPKDARNYIIPVKYFEAVWEDDVHWGRRVLHVKRYNNLIIDSAIAEALPRLTPDHAWILID